MIDKLLEHVRRFLRLSFFERTSDVLTPWQVITWWEGRRVFYNLLVGGAGMVSVALCLVSALIGEAYLDAPIGLPDPPFFAFFIIIAYGFMANVCFTGGWIVEIIVRRIWGDQGLHFGKISFVLGVVFSILLTLLPGVFISMVLMFQLLISVLSP